MEDSKILKRIWMETENNKDKHLSILKEHWSEEDHLKYSASSFTKEEKKREVIDTLDALHWGLIEYIPDRRRGNTTRIIDYIIQKLFEGYEVICNDHHESVEARKYLVNRVLARLSYEHNIDGKVKGPAERPIIYLE